MVKEKDIPRDIQTAQSTAVGYCGSDTWEEAAALARSGLKARPVSALGDLRFALACRPQKLAEVRAKLANSEPLRLGTSYPVTARRVLGERMLSPLIRAGAIEGLPERFPELDGIFEIVKSGDSLRANGLVIAEDVLESIRLIEVQRVTQGPTTAVTEESI